LSSLTSSFKSEQKAESLLDFEILAEYRKNVNERKAHGIGLWFILEKKIIER
jgi:hypothetical protein